MNSGTDIDDEISLGADVQQPRSRAAFESALRGDESRYWDRHPFHLRMAGGQLSPAQLRAWVANRWYYQKMLPQKDAAIIANCPQPDVRRQWVGRITYHDGTDDHDGGREMWLTLVDAVGLTRDEVIDERHVLPGVRHAVDAYVAFARQRTWYEGVASSLTELFAPRAMAARVASWRKHYPWIVADGLRYFQDRVGRATGEGAGALEIVLGTCHSREQQDAAIAAVHFKFGVLWGMVDAIDHATERS